MVLSGKDLQCCQKQYLQGIRYLSLSLCWKGKRQKLSSVFSRLLQFDRLGSKVKLSWKLSAITKLESGGYNLTYETPDGVVYVHSKTVVMTVPSHVASSLLRPLSVSFSFLGTRNLHKAEVLINSCGFLYQVLQLLPNFSSILRNLQQMHSQNFIIHQLQQYLSRTRKKQSEQNV